MCGKNETTLVYFFVCIFFITIYAAIPIKAVVETYIECFEIARDAPFFLTLYFHLLFC